MLESIQVSLQAIAGHGQTAFLLITAVAILYGGPVNPTTDATAGTSSTISKQACKSEGCIFYQSTELYLSIRLMEFRGVVVNGSSLTMDTKRLSREYNNTGVTVNTTNHTLNFTYSFGNQEDFFNISMIFWMDANRHNWSLVMVTYIYSDETLSDERYKHRGQHEEEYYYEDVGEDYEDDGEDYEDDGQDNEAADTYNDENYDAENDTVLTHTYPLRVGASENTAYTCDNLAGVSNNSDSEMHIYDFTMQPFHADKSNPPSKTKDCRESVTDEGDNIGLILGTIAGVAIVITVVIVIATYLYRRRKRGKYNLLH